MNRDLLHEKWQDYLFLTNEMKKILMKHDLKLFFSLVEQRETLQLELEKLSNKAYNTTSQGKKLLLEIQMANDDMMAQFNGIFNAMKKQRNVSKSYEGVASFAGKEYK